MAALMENSLRVNVEFMRSSGQGGRLIRFNHTPDIVPGQLQGRVSPQDWHAFMMDADALAKSHPYVGKPGAKKICGWAACFAIGSVVGLMRVDPDGGDYSVWYQEAAAVVAKHQPMFEKAGCMVSLQNRRDQWLQIDIDPNRSPFMPVVGYGVPPPAGPPGQPPSSPFESTPGTTKV